MFDILNNCFYQILLLFFVTLNLRFQRNIILNFLEIIIDQNEGFLSDVPFESNLLTVETDSDTSDMDSTVSSISEFAITTSRLNFSNEEDPSTDDSLDWQF